MQKRNCYIIFFTILLLIGVVIFQIPNGNTPIIISGITKDYLKECGITNYKIVSFGEYQGKKLEIPQPIIEDEEIRKYIEVLMEAYAHMEPIKNRNTVQTGDFVYVSYREFCEDKEINIVSGDVLKVGAGYYNPTFEELLPGAIVGQEFTKELHIGDEDGILQKHTYYITINSIQKYVTYELNETFVKDKLGLSSVQMFYEEAKKKLFQEKQKELYHKAESEWLMELIENTEIVFDEQEVALYAKKIVEEYSELAYIYNMSLEEYHTTQMNLNETQFYEHCYEEARLELEAEMIIGIIGAREKIKIADNEIENSGTTGQQLLKEKVLQLFK